MKHNTHAIAVSHTACKDEFRRNPRFHSFWFLRLSDEYLVQESEYYWYYKPVKGVPGGLAGGPRAHHDQFRGFKSHRVHARKGFFLHEKEIDQRKARERE